jgi:hypothetical protein
VVHLLASIISSSADHKIERKNSERFLKANLWTALPTAAPSGPGTHAPMKTRPSPRRRGPFPRWPASAALLRAFGRRCRFTPLLFFIVRDDLILPCFSLASAAAPTFTP